MSQPVDIGAMVEEALYWEAVEKAAAERRRACRQRIEDEARKDLESKGVAPTWRTRAATVPLSISKPAVRIVDEKAWTAWVKHWNPSEIEKIERVRPAFQSHVLAQLVDSVHNGYYTVDEDGNLKHEDGITGVVYEHGGQVRGVTIRATSDVKKMMAAVAEIKLDKISEIAQEWGPEVLGANPTYMEIDGH